jgi:DNA (cytosine-5)-methyltransferase 1
MPQPNYCGDEFYQADAVEFPLVGFDAVHASPPCQHYSVTASLHSNEHPDMYVAIRELLMATGVPWAIENVIGAPYASGIVLCGSMFGLGVWRHRNFETSNLLFAPSCRHELVPAPVDVTGTGGPGGRHRKPSNLQHAREVMGIDWMTRRELSQAIPPAYTSWIGTHLMAALGQAAA